MEIEVGKNAVKNKCYKAPEEMKESYIACAIQQSIIQSIILIIRDRHYPIIQCILLVLLNVLDVSAPCNRSQLLRPFPD